MRVSPYLQFSGNCAEAVALYEKAFGGKAVVLRYKDAPPSEGYQNPAGTEDFVMHAQLSIGGDSLLFCDVPPGVISGFGDGLAIHVNFDSEDAVKAAFDILRDGGEIGTEPQKTFWSRCFGSLKDKFGVSWMISMEGEGQ